MHGSAKESIAEHAEMQWRALSAYSDCLDSPCWSLTWLPSVWAGKATVGTHMTHGTGPPQSELKGDARPAGNS
jgi:hypothetical protein